MRIAFRTDASLQIGTGHVMRCLTLADALREHGAQCRFICRPHSGHLLDLIAKRGHQAIALPAANDHYKAPADPAHAAWLGTDWATDAEQTSKVLDQQPMDWLVVDHYALDHRWEQAMRPACHRLMVIDDLADRPHDCDLLLDQNLGRTEHHYDDLLKAGTQRLIGPHYVLLRPEFAQWREYSLARRTQPKLKHLLITMGGVDQGNVTGQILGALKICELPQNLQITVVMGPKAPWLSQVQSLAVEMPWPTEVLVGVNNMAQLMANSDLAIGAAGGTAWERCVLGLPTIVVVLAENQQSGAIALQDVGAAVWLQDINKISAMLPQFLFDMKTDLPRKMSESAANLADGLGTFRVVEQVLGKHV